MRRRSRERAPPHLPSTCARLHIMLVKLDAIRLRSALSKPSCGDRQTCHQNHINGQISCAYSFVMCHVSGGRQFVWLGAKVQ